MQNVKLMKRARKLAFKIRHFLLSKRYPPLRPSFMIIGAQKGGTTALFEYMSQHPGVSRPYRKEMNFFNCDVRYRKGVEAYHTNFPRKAPDNVKRLTFDATPAYLFNCYCPGRIYDYDPEMKFILLLRDPIRRAFSAWQMYRTKYQENAEWFLQWVADCNPARVDVYRPRPPSFGESFVADIHNELEARERGNDLEMPILGHGFYAQQIRRYLHHFSGDQIFAAASERLRAVPADILAQIEAFLGLQRYDWPAVLLRPVHVGAYSEPVPRDAIVLLQEVYKTSNEETFALLGKQFPWL